MIYCIMIAAAIQLTAFYKFLFLCGVIMHVYKIHCHIIRAVLYIRANVLSGLLASKLQRISLEPFYFSKNTWFTGYPIKTRNFKLMLI